MPSPVYSQPAVLPQSPQTKQGLSALKIVLIIGVILFCILIIITYIGSQPDNPPIPWTQTSTTVPTPAEFSHVPSEVIPGFVASGGSYRITTYLRDPATTSYSIRLAGPKNADLDLYVKRSYEPTTNDYDYHSSGADSDEQVGIMNPDLGNYYILVQSVRGGGDFTLVITYQYS